MVDIYGYTVSFIPYHRSDSFLKLGFRLLVERAFITQLSDTLYIKERQKEEPERNLAEIVHYDLIFEFKN